MMRKILAQSVGPLVFAVAFSPVPAFAADRPVYAKIKATPDATVYVKFLVLPVVEARTLRIGVRLLLAEGHLQQAGNQLQTIEGFSWDHVSRDGEEHMLTLRTFDAAGKRIASAKGDLMRFGFS